MLLFLHVVSAPSPDVLKEDELSSMTTYSVPNISFSSTSFEMNTEEKIGSASYGIYSSVWLADVTIASISMFEFRCGL